ncbi:hypothetical protein M406DRAFT_358084 [Cryphonectria parasitica EP155]|uniref:Uncharacterized protein n=1 Tax=Cryphonectria parasitica (strain ATCC 38755 / EP155) TaxID=660469 RepID=A0A9P4XVX0_CRYP1|nr:uncharacterized protein M406DRAFT_358084 [Cryphonectria parasitica EP155]KAF3761740.1 hypothetical protein M406DRAFT_358084 [Cryphonectria parasitica EP155]
MAREGTRSATGNSKPRVFPTVDTAPTISRKPRAQTSTKKEGAKPAGVTKKKGPVKSNGVANKAKAAVKKVEAKVKKVTAKKPKAKKAAPAE